MIRVGDLTLTRETNPEFFGGAMSATIPADLVPAVVEPLEETKTAEIEVEPDVQPFPKVAIFNRIAKEGRRAATLKAMKDAAGRGFAGVQFDELSMAIIAELRELEYKVTPITDDTERTKWTVSWEY